MLFQRERTASKQRPPSCLSLHLSHAHVVLQIAAQMYMQRDSRCIFLFGSPCMGALFFTGFVERRRRRVLCWCVLSPAGKRHSVDGGFTAVACSLMCASCTKIHSLSQTYQSTAFGSSSSSGIHVISNGDPASSVPGHPVYPFEPHAHGVT